MRSCGLTASLSLICNPIYKTQGQKRWVLLYDSKLKLGIFIFVCSVSDTCHI